MSLVAAILSLSVPPDAPKGRDGALFGYLQMDNVVECSRVLNTELLKFDIAVLGMDVFGDILVQSPRAFQ